MQNSFMKTTNRQKMKKVQANEKTQKRIRTQKTEKKVSVEY